MMSMTPARATPTEIMAMMTMPLGSARIQSRKAVIPGTPPQCTPTQGMTTQSTSTQGRRVCLRGTRIPGIRLLAITCMRRRILAGRSPSALR